MNVLVTKRLSSVLFFHCCILNGLIAQPVSSANGLIFKYCGVGGKVALAGDFNQWQKNADALTKDFSGCWKITKVLKPGIFQYKFVIDDTLWVSDSSNPKLVQNYNNSGFNSVLTVKQDGAIVFESYQEA